MELRSRSRSNTPFLRQSHESDMGNHVTRITRRSARTVETVSAEGKLKKSKTQKSRYVTSDYSSEEGETIVSSSGMDNIKNQIKEELAHTSVNGNGEVSALKLYKEAGEYWNKFPKTDYTYSRHSKDRVELAPGVVVMPNMSRRSLHSSCSETIVSNKETNTEESFYSSFVQKLKPQMLFTNNNEDDSFVIHRRKLIRKASFFQKIVIYFLTVCQFILYPIYYLYNRQQSLFLWFGKIFHKIASTMMLWDTWTLQKNVSTDKKLYGIVTLCLMPLFLFGGMWCLYGIISGVYTWMSSAPPIIHSTSEVENLPRIIDGSLESSNIFDFDNIDFQKKMIKFIEGMGFFKRSVESSPHPKDIAKGLTKQQLNAIAESVQINNVDYIVQKLLDNPKVQRSILFNDNDRSTDINKELRRNEENNLLIETLQSEIIKLRDELDFREKAWRGEVKSLLNQIQSQNKEENAKLSLEFKRTHRHSFIQIEHYVTKILKDLLGVPKYMTKLDDISKWLHTIFVAKEDLEERIANLTQTLKFDFNQVVQNNVKVIMDDVSRKISKEMSANLHKIDHDGSSHLEIGTLDDDHVRRIVSEALAIYDADKTGLVDYAMESAGGQIVSTRCTESYQVKTAVVSILGIPVWYPTNTPRTVITPGTNPGDCWAFQNFPGFLLIKLSGFVKISSFSMEHLSRNLAPHGKIDSAPREFEVYGMQTENDLATVLLGKYKYVSDGESLQFFPIQTEVDTFEMVELRILSNQGNPNYTCLYRFRVHGELKNGPT